MNTSPLLTAACLLGLCSGATAGDVIRLEPARPRIHSEYFTSATLDPNGRVTAVNGVPVVTQVPSLRHEAECGDARSQVLLAKALDRHATGSTNRVEAYMWALVASSRGVTEGKELTRGIGLFLSDAERAQGRSKADSFVPRARKSP